MQNPKTYLAVVFVVALLLTTDPFTQRTSAQPAGGAPVPAAAAAKSKKKGVRLKDLARVAGVRSNQLLGYGLVVGLPGTGDTRSKLASNSIRNLLGNLGQTLASSDLEARNIAAVLVTAEYPAFSRRGDRLNVIVSSIGDARSLEGGVLIRTALQAADKNIYAAAQGVITTGGRRAGRLLRSTGKTVGMVLGGASVEREIAVDYAANRRIRISLKRFDFATLSEIKKGIIKTFPALSKKGLAVNGGSIDIEIPVGTEPVDFIAQLEQIRVEPRYRARVVINERTGTIVMGGEIRVDPVAVSRGGVRLIITGRSKVADGVTKELKIEYGPGRKEAEKRKTTNQLAGTSISEIITALNAMGAGVRDIIAILEALRDSGALHAEVIVI